MKDASLQRRVQRWLTGAILRRALKVTVEGREYLPSAGPYIMVFNHLHISDGMLLWSISTASTVFLSTDKFRKTNPLVHTYLRGTGALLIREGVVDRRAIRESLAALAAGGSIAIAPEGRISKTGALCEAEPGVASLICHSQAPVVPVAIWGQHQAHKMWMAGKRPEVTIRFGRPVQFGRIATTGPNLRSLTTQVMTEVAQLLPPQYRGVYSTETREEMSLCV